MPAIAKLFRLPENASTALANLKAQGYSWEQIGVLGKTRELTLSDKAKAIRLQLPRAGECWAWGALTPLAQSQDPQASLSRLLGLSPETLDYYEFGLALGAVLVSIQVDGDNLEGAGKLLREADALPSRESASPGFKQANPMTDTDPVDEKMTGDFRRY